MKKVSSEQWHFCLGTANSSTYLWPAARERVGKTFCWHLVPGDWSSLVHNVIYDLEEWEVMPYTLLCPLEVFRLGGGRPVEMMPRMTACANKEPTSLLKWAASKAFVGLTRPQLLRLDR